MSTQAWAQGRRVVSRTPAFVAAGIYVTPALMGRGVPAGELFPFFSWDLFSRVPADTLEGYEPLERHRHGTVATVTVQRFIGEVPVEDPYWTSPDGRQVVSSSGAWTLTSNEGGDQRGGGRVRVLVRHGDEVLGAATTGLPRRDIRQASGTVALVAAGFAGSVQSGPNIDLHGVRVVALYPDETARVLP